MADKVSLIFPAYNRLEFTKQSWAALMANTDWALVAEFHVYDDGSTDGTREFLNAEFGKRFCRSGAFEDLVKPLPVALWHETKFRSPMGVTLDWIRRGSAPLLAKLDNDTIYPPGWLNAALDVMRHYPSLDMLGLEAMRTIVSACDVYPDGTYETGDDRMRFGYLPAKFVSGLGIYRRSAFEVKASILVPGPEANVEPTSLPHDGGYFGFEEWMQAAKLTCGWILPSLPVFLLDRLPMEPWKSLSEEYVRKGWQRAWSGASQSLRYKPEQHEMWDWWRPVE